MKNDFDPLGFGGYRSFAQTIKQPTVPKAAQKKKDEKGFWTDQISTGGGIGGALAGGAAGAAIGSAVPIVGTAIGGLAGAILGGALGSGGGELAENYITGEEDKFKNVGTEALFGGATSIPLGAALKVGQAGLKATTGIGKTGAKDLLQQAGEKTVGNKAVQVTTTGKQNFGQKVADKMYSQAFTTPRRKAGELNAEDTSRQLLNYGIGGSLDKIDQASTQVLKNVGGLFDQAVTSVGGQIRTGDVTGIAKNALKGVKITAPEQKALFERVSDIGTKGVMPGYSSPSQLLEEIRGLERYGYSRINAAQSGLIKNPDLEDIGSAYVQVAKELEDNLYSAISKSGSLKALQTPQVAAQLNGIAKGLGDKFVKATDAKEVRTLMSPFVRAKTLVDSTMDEAQSAGSQGLAMLGGRGAGAGIGAIAGGIPGAAAGFLAAPLMRGVEESVRAPIATGAAKLVNNLSSRAPKEAAGQGLVGLTARQAIGQNVLSPQNQTPTLSEALMQTSGNGQPGAGAVAQPPIEQSPYPRENLIADMQRDPANADEYMKQYQMYQELYAPTATELTSGQQKTATTAQNALPDIAVIEQAIESGEIDKMLVPFNDNALVGSILGTGDINAALFNLGDVILRSRTGAAAPPAEVEKFVAGYLPRAGESLETKRYKLQRALSELQGMVNPPKALSTTRATQ